MACGNMARPALRLARKSEPELVLEGKNSMAIERLNCWEYSKCGRESCGNSSDGFGVCPAASEASFDGINGGQNGGRICWAIAGTFCEDKVQGSFAEKRGTCLECDFFKRVQREEGTNSHRVKFLQFVSEEASTSILKKMGFRHVRAGERFLRQGQQVDAAYIIQRGSCLAFVEKDDAMLPVGHYGKGDIVGVIAILTGEPQGPHVEAETDMDLWVVNRDLFENISNEDPELMRFLTELVAERFDSRRPIAHRVIGKYVATSFVRSGGYAIVYKGVHTGLNMPVAIKMMRHNMAMDPDFLSSFHNEAKTIASLRHDNIVRIYDIEEKYRTVFIIMEYLDGETVRDMIERLKRISPRLAVDFLAQSLVGLDYAHSMGIIHRDIAPGNIMVEPGDHVKILDFGLACAIGTDEYGAAGTLWYTAPEQINGDVVDQRTDIYSLGITAYEMVTGEKPFAKEDVETLKHLTMDIPDPGKIVPDLPPELRQFILKACRREPGERYASAAEALDALMALWHRRNFTKKSVPAGQQKMKALFLVYEEGQESAVNRLIMELGTRADEMEITINVADALTLSRRGD